jgi:hypothetical protein
MLTSNIQDSHSSVDKYLALLAISHRIIAQKDFDELLNIITTEAAKLIEAERAESLLERIPASRAKTAIGVSDPVRFKLGCRRVDVRQELIVMMPTIRFMRPSIPEEFKHATSSAFPSAYSPRDHRVFQVSIIRRKFTLKTNNSSKPSVFTRQWRSKMPRRSQTSKPGNKLCWLKMRHCASKWRGVTPAGAFWGHPQKSTGSGI